MVLIVIPLIAILIPAILTWAKDLNPVVRRVRQLDEQSKLVDFWDSWIKAMSSTVPRGLHKDKTEGITISLLHEARIELLNAGRNVLSLYRADELHDYREFKLSFAEFQEYRANLSWFHRTFLLYKSPNRAAKNSKILFFWNILSPVAIGPIEIPLLNHYELGQRTLYLLLNGTIGPSHVRRLFFAIIFLVIVLFYWVGSSIYYRNRTIRFENDPDRYVNRNMNRIEPIDQES